MKILITGSNGFIGKNLRVALAEQDGVEVLEHLRETSDDQLAAMVLDADRVVHLAGVNRPKDPVEFETGNSGLASKVCSFLRRTGRSIPVAFASSIQAELDNPYGVSKRGAEEAFRAYGEDSGAGVAIYRLPNVFGKWSKPNYNSAVATFCYNVARGLPVTINDPSAAVKLVYVDDVVEEFKRFIASPPTSVEFPSVAPVHEISVGELAEQIEAFRSVRSSLVVERVGTGLTRALYATFVSFLEPTSFSYGVPKYGDNRGVFVEMLKTKDSGQFSFFTAHPGVTRGGHYHHTKTEKFLVIKGIARYRFRHLLTDELFEIESNGEEPLVVETIPGWVHDITNIGSDELVVMLWANEIFDRQRPDTVAAPVSGDSA